MDRAAALQTLQSGQTFDLLIIGGGATGCGVALDAISRGLSVALIERNDFAEGTSSRSTKLVHGGVRYLELAIRHLDRVQYNLVKDGLHERGLFLKNAPHLADRLPLITPLYRWMDIPYVYAGLKLYDLLAGKLGLGPSRLLSRKEALRRFPMLKDDGLKAGVLYYDGQFNDARMAVTLAMTAAEQGAAIATRVEAVGLNIDKNRLCGAMVEDRETGARWEIKARGVINACGPFSDSVRRMADPQAGSILTASSGIHIVLDKRFAPADSGLLIPKTEDGRVLFVLPWQGHALIGTTDEPAEIEAHPRPKAEEVAYLLRHVRQYFNLDVSESDILSVWSGLRPLVSDPKAADTAHLARDHVIEMGSTGLLTICGGKWTTYRKMAEHAVDHAVGVFALTPRSGCRTVDLPLVGAAGFDRAKGIDALIREFSLDRDVAHHLHHAYGDRAPRVLRYAAASGQGAVRLHPAHPYLEAEVIYATRHEAARSAMDVLARRLSLALVDRAAARDCSARVIALMAPELGWDDSRRQAEAAQVEERLTQAI